MIVSIILAVLIAIICTALVGWIFFFRKNIKKSINQVPQATPTTGAYASLQLQAYERLSLLIDRIALPNLISRLNVPGSSATEMHLLMVQTVKQEFDYNITQQIYVSSDAWTAVKQLKDQNLLTINHLASTLPSDASGALLCKVLLEYLVQNPVGNLHEVAAELVAFEAKKLL